MKKSPENPRDGNHRFLAVCASFCILAALGCWLESRAVRSHKSSHASLVGEIEQMAKDAAQIKALRAAPRLATERVRPNDELLQEVRDAIKASGMASEKWIASDPVPAVRMPQTPYKLLSIRLTFAGVTLRRLVAFAHHLNRTNPAIGISHLRLSSPHDSNDEIWDAELTLSYLIYSPV